MNERRLKEILGKMSGVSVAVIGDFCLDAYWMIDNTAAQVSLETGKLTQTVREQRYSLGGAANVVHNLVDLGVKSVFGLGVIGDDPFGRELLRQLTRIGVNVEGLLVQEGEWDTPVYAKPHQKDEEQQRIDFGMFNQIKPDTAKKLIRRLEGVLDRVQSVIINQQLDNSIYTKTVIDEINRLVLAHPGKYFVADRRQGSEAFKQVHLKLNQWEAARLAGIDRPSGGVIPLEDIMEYAREIRDKTAAKTVFISRESRGIVVYDGRQSYEVPGIRIRGRIDAVGAGDTATSAIAAALAGGATANEAAQLANFASTVTIQKLFRCGTASPAEILDIAGSPDRRCNP